MFDANLRHGLGVSVGPGGLARAGVSLAVLFAAQSIATGQQKASPADFLQKMFEQRDRVAMVAVQVFRAPDHSGSQMTLKFEADGKGSTRRTVLQPLSKQGIVTIDDGKSWTTFLPDSQEALVQPSPSLSLGKGDQRIALIKKNYTLSVGVPTKVGGRRVLTIQAKSSADMPTRIYYLDTRTFVLLRYESEFRNSTRMWIDTKTVEFPDRDEPVEIAAPGGKWKYRKCEAPTIVRDYSSARSLVGFHPIVPKELPAGFVVSEMHVLDSGKDAFLGLRISDGLVQATVYQWLTSRKPKDPSVALFRSVTNSRGVTFQVFGDLPRSVRDKILTAFAK